MRNATRRFAIACALLAGCGGEAPTFTVRGAGVVVNSDAEFAHAPDLPSRVETTVDAALRYWGGTWRDVAGLTIELDGSRQVKCGSAESVGCYDGDIRVSTLDAGRAVDCVEQTTLVHEIGHAVIGDADHLDPRWLDFDAVDRALSGRRGYRGGEVVPCAVSPYVWRHPPGRPHALPESDGARPGARPSDGRDPE